MTALVFEFWNRAHLSPLSISWVKTVVTSFSWERITLLKKRKLYVQYEIRRSMSCILNNALLAERAFRNTIKKDWYVDIQTAQ